MRSKRQIVGILCGVIALAAGLQAAEKLTYVDLVKHLTDMERIAVLPVPGETCAQASSYNRASKYVVGYRGQGPRKDLPRWRSGAGGGSGIR